MRWRGECSPGLGMRLVAQLEASDRSPSTLTKAPVVRLSRNWTLSIGRLNYRLRRPSCIQYSFTKSTIFVFSCRFSRVAAELRPCGVPNLCLLWACSRWPMNTKSWRWGVEKLGMGLERWLAVVAKWTCYSELPPTPPSKQVIPSDRYCAATTLMPIHL